jgi:uncharacterized radical SAM superfamily Fe-S cluster-containing enzyme
MRSRVGLEATSPAGTADGAEIFHSAYRGLCPHCRQVCDGVRVLRNGKVFGVKQCPVHGASTVLLSGDAEWFLRSRTCIKPALVPRHRATSTERGCPSDCGLCPEHGQHTCLPIVEITDHCNLDCPVCLVDNRHRFMMTKEQLRRIVDGLIAAEGALETINLSGGEPTLHPELLELIEIARRPEIARVSVSSNGVLLAEKPQLCRALADRGVYVSLQLDGFDRQALRRLRGSDERGESARRALANLEAAGARTTLVLTAARGVNEHLPGEALQVLLSHENVLSLMVQPVTHTGRAVSFGPADPCDVLTIPDVVKLLAEQSRGVLQYADFVPLPCSHPSCFALCYLLSTGNGEWTPFRRFVDFDRYLSLLANRGTMRPDGQLEETLRVTIDELWTGADQLPDNRRILGALKGVLRRMCPEGRAVEAEARLRIGEATVKTIFVHGFMDVHTFDLERVRKCCTHYARADGRLMPACTFNIVHRGASLVDGLEGGR